MCRKLSSLISLVLLLGLVSNASAALLARYNFEGNLKDLSNDVSVGGSGAGGTLTAVGNATTSNAQAAVGSYSLALDGTGDAAQAADSGKLQLGANYTLAAWIRFDQVGAMSQTIVSKSVFNTQASYFFWYEYSTGASQRAIRLVNTSTGAWLNPLYIQWSPSANTWYHVAIAVSGTNTYMYVDGNLLTTTTSGGPGPVASPPFASTALFTVGALGDIAAPFDGYIDDVGVWDTALTSAQINTVKTSGAPEPATIALLGLGGLAMVRMRRKR